jgi:xanthine/CO dehydrogenase XdhC/CoxF family maturation factor
LKHWQELRQVLDRALVLAQTGQPTALAIVTAIRGSAYRRPGAKLLIEADGSSLGGVSGGCLEDDVRDIGQQVLRSGCSRRVHYETGDDDGTVWGLGLGCEGAVDVAVVPLTAADALQSWTRVRELLDGDAGFALSLDVEDRGRGCLVVTTAAGRLCGRLDEPAADAAVDAVAAAALRSGRTSLHSFGAHHVFSEALAPPPTLLVCGAGDDSRPLVAFAAATGFRVCVADHRAAYLTPERFPAAHRRLRLRPEDASTELPADGRTHAVVMTHSLARDTAWLRRLCTTDVPYVGVLGPRARTEKMLATLGPHRPDRIFGPVGLDLGADGPEQVALSILAEVLAAASGREARHLRERAAGVHAC